MTRKELREHCERQIQQFERVEKIMPVTLNDFKRYEEHKLILELLEQEPKTGHWIEMGQNKDKTHNVICSECKVGFKFKGHANSIYTQMKYRFCSYCGADMRGE